MGGKDKNIGKMWETYIGGKREILQAKGEKHSYIYSEKGGNTEGKNGENPMEYVKCLKSNMRRLAVI